MGKLALRPRIYEQCNRTVVVSGVARSGTTIMGKTLHSLDRVEYAFEPPMLVSLFPLITQLSEAHWKLLYETYLFEEFLVNALAGRALNCNVADDSSVYRVKPSDLIEQRLSVSLRKADADKQAEDSCLAFKVPDVLPLLGKLKAYYPGSRIVIMTRPAPAVFSSMLAKGWFCDETLREQNLSWPNRVRDGVEIPYWVDPTDDHTWWEMDELHRIAYYYLTNSRALAEIPGAIQVKYEDLLHSPEPTIRSLAERLELSWGAKTTEIVATIGRTKSERDPQVLQRLSPGVREEVEHYSRLS
jgi:hypothetical protein